MLLGLFIWFLGRPWYFYARWLLCCFFLLFKVISRSGRVLGTKEVRVGNDKVSLERLEVAMVTGLQMDLEPEPELPGTLVARMSRTSQLRKKYQVGGLHPFSLSAIFKMLPAICAEQSNNGNLILCPQEGVLDIAVKFSDGSTLPLGYFPATDYFLDMDTLNNHVVAFVHMKSADTPRVIALGPGKGELLKLALELGDACQRKKSRRLAVSYAYVDVDFTKDSEDVQNDAGHYGYNRPSHRDEDMDTDVKEHLVYVEQKQRKSQEGDKDRSHPKEEKVAAIPLGTDIARVGGDTGQGTKENTVQTHHEAQQQPIVRSGGMTPSGDWHVCPAGGVLPGYSRVPGELLGVCGALPQAAQADWQQRCARPWLGVDRTRDTGTQRHQHNLLPGTDAWGRFQWESQQPWITSAREQQKFYGQCWAARPQQCGVHL